MPCNVFFASILTVGVINICIKTVYKYKLINDDYFKFLYSLLEIDFLIERRDQTVHGPRRPDEQELGNATSKSWVTHGRVEARAPRALHCIVGQEVRSSYEAITRQYTRKFRRN